MRIAHITDTHIHNLTHHEEYQVIFRKMHERLTVFKPDWIIHTGDIVHQKVTMSPELIKLTSGFLEMLSQHCPVLVLLGNHDGLVNNKGRLSAISPIIELLNDSRGDDHNPIRLLDYLENKTPRYINADGEGFSLGIFSIFEEQDTWPITPFEPKELNIALYHGMVGNESGTIIGDDGIILRSKNFLPLSTFKNYDYGLFGHVHEYQELDKAGKFVYGGSTVQTRFGESLSKGFWIWDIESKTKFTKEFIEIKNPVPYCKVTIPEGMTLTSAKKGMSKFDIVPGCHLSVVVKSSDISNKDMDVLMDMIIKKYNPKDYDWKRHKNVFSRQNDYSILMESSDIDLTKINTVETQCDLIESHLSNNFGVTDTDMLQKVLELHKKYYDQAQNLTRLEKPVGTWSLKSMVWDNLFNYGENNSIVFEHEFGPLTGIFGRNKSGKSSILDILAFALFNRTAKGGSNFAKIINTRKKTAGVWVDLVVDGENFRITRQITRGKGDSSTGTVGFLKTDADGNIIGDLGGEGKKDTDKIIQQKIGTFEDFLLSSYAAQFNFLKFVEDGPTDRLKTFKDICDLNFFDDIVLKTKDEYKVLKKTVDKADYKLIIAQREMGIITLKEDLEKIEQAVLDNQTRVELQEVLLLDVNSAIKAMEGRGLGGLDIKTLKVAKGRTEVELERLRRELVQTIEKEESLKEQCAEYAQRISSFDRGFLKDQIKELESDEKRLQKLETEKKLLEREIENDNKVMETVQGVPCQEHETFPYECPYIADAAKLFETVENKAKMLERLILDGNDYREMVADKKKFKKQLEDFNILEVEWNGMRRELESARSRIKDKTTLIGQAEETLKELDVKIQRAEEEKDIIENYEMKKLELQTLKNVLSKFKTELQQSYFERDKINYSIKSCGEVILDSNCKIKSQLEHTEILQAYEHYLTAIDGKTGLPMEIIRKLLPYINNEITIVLAGMDDLQVYFDVSSNDSIEIYLKNNDADEPRTVNMGSGYEKQMTSVAIRMALLEVMKMAHCDTIFLDEPATALDADHLLEFGKLIELLKRKFSKIYLITHMEFLKDIVDFSYDIQADENGFATLV